MLDIIIKNGIIIDGSGKKRYISDIGVKDNYICKIQSNIEDCAARYIDAKGLIVSPGFIDAHGHSDFTIFINNFGESKIRQGITTEVVGNCGFTAGPIVSEHKNEQLQYLANTIVLNDEMEKIWDWKSQKSFLDYSSRDGMSFNLAPLVGHGMIHVGVMGFDQRKPTHDEMDKMKALLKSELDSGFYGLSTAFQYEPGNFIDMDEIAELCEMIRDYGGIYAIHMRDEGKDLIPCVKHAIEIARRTGVRIQISHLKATYKPNWGKVNEALTLIDEAEDAGLDVGFDVYPYTAYGSGLIDLVPPWAKRDGPKEMINLLKYEETRRRALKDMEEGLEDWETIMVCDDWDECVKVALLKSDKNKKYEGMTIKEIAEDMKCTPYEAVIQLLIDEDASVKCIFFAMCEKDLVYAMSHPEACFGTDGRACATYGELSKGSVHPRYYGTYPRIMGHYTREEKVLTLEEAVKKSTSLPAERFNIRKRGAIKEDYFADITIFDPDVIIDTATFENPHQYPKGIEYVIVNGQMVIEKGFHTGNLPGIVLNKIAGVKD